MGAIEIRANATKTDVASPPDVVTTVAAGRDAR